jgi:hypothetical protein
MFDSKSYKNQSQGKNIGFGKIIQTRKTSIPIFLRVPVI